MLEFEMPCLNLEQGFCIFSLTFNSGFKDAIVSPAGNDGGGKFLSTC